MRNSEVMKALKAAFTGYERNSNAALLELLSDDFTFEMSDSLPYGGTYIGCEEFLGFWRAVAKLQFCHEIAMRAVKERDRQSRRRHLGIETEFDIIGIQLPSPCGLSGRIRCWRGMAEEIQIDGLRRLPADGAQFGTNLIRAQHRAAHRTEAADLRDGRCHCRCG